MAPPHEALCPPQLSLVYNKRIISVQIVYTSWCYDTALVLSLTCGCYDTALVHSLICSDLLASDMTFTHEGNKTYFSSLVNFEKMVSTCVLAFEFGNERGDWELAPKLVGGRRGEIPLEEELKFVSIRAEQGDIRTLFWKIIMTNSVFPMM